MTPFILIYTSYALINGMPHGYPNAIIQIFAYFLGYWISRFQILRIKIIGLFMFLTVLSVGSYYGIPNYTYYLKGSSNDNFQSISNYKLIDKNFNEVYINDFKGKIVVIDFWNSACGVCFKKFPDYNDLFNYYSDNDEVVVLSVNLKLKNKSLEDVIKFSERFKYNFPILFTDSFTAEQIKSELNISGVPTLVILDRNLKVFYSGYLITEDNIFVNNAYRKINQALH